MRLVDSWSSRARTSAGLLAAFAVFVAACGGQAQHRPGDDAGVGGSGSETASGGSSSSSPSPRPRPTIPAAGGSTQPNDPGPAGGSAGAVVVIEGGAPDAGGAPSSEGGGGDEPPVPSCDPIVFEDPDVEFRLRATLEKPSGALHPADVAGLMYFAASGVKSLQGVECLTDLQSFSMGELPFGNVTDLSPLANLSQLVELDIGLNPIASLEPLAKLLHLENLYADGIPVELDLTPLARAPKLTTLYLRRDTVKDLKPLGSVATLRILDLRLGHVVHPEGVSALTQLEDFDATSVFTDVAPLASLTNLKRLRISQKKLEHFAALKTLIHLQFLDIGNAGVVSLAPVAQMTELRFLLAGGNQITQTEPLGALTQLSSVALVDNQIVDLGPLVQNPAIDAGDFVYLDRNAFACAPQAVNLQALRARGVTVSSDCQ